MDSIIAAAPTGIVDSYMSLVLPMIGSGLGLGVIGWVVQGAWASALAIFEV